MCGPDERGGWQGCLPSVLREVLRWVQPSYVPIGLTWRYFDLEIRYAGPAEGACALDCLPEEHTRRRWPRARFIIRRDSNLWLPSITFDPGGDPEEFYWEEGDEDEDFFL